MTDNPAGAGTPYRIKISRIDRFEGQPRHYFDQAGLESLADSLMQPHAGCAPFPQGDLSQEVPVKLCAAGGARFVLIDGERRWRAHRIIQERTGVEPTILAFVEVVRDPKEHYRKSVIANLHGEHLIPVDEAASLAALREQYSVAELSRLVGKSTTYVDNYLKLHQLPDAVKEMMSPTRVRDRRLTATAAIDIARSTKNPTLQLEIAREACDRTLSLGDTRQLIERKTGLAGHRMGGARRKPSDDYRDFTGTLGRMRVMLGKCMDLEFDRLYAHRDDERADRVHDALVVSNNVMELTVLRDVVMSAGREGVWRDLDVLRIDLLLSQLREIQSRMEKSDARSHARG